MRYKGRPIGLCFPIGMPIFFNRHINKKLRRFKI